MAKAVVLIFHPSPELVVEATAMAETNLDEPSALF
jgi:hypothetical protein